MSLTEKEIKENNLEEIYLIDIEQKETKYYFNFAMLFTAVRMNGKTMVRCGAYKFLIKLVDDNLINEIDK